MGVMPKRAAWADEPNEDDSAPDLAQVAAEVGAMEHELEDLPPLELLQDDGSWAAAASDGKQESKEDSEAQEIQAEDDGSWAAAASDGLAARRTTRLRRFRKVKDDKFTSTQLEHADNIRKSRFKKLHKEQTAEFDDEQKEPNPPAEQKDPEGLQTLDILYKAVQEFVAEHISDAAIQEEIWRKQFAKQLFATDNRVKAVQSALRSEENEELEQLRARCRELEVVNRVQSALSSRDNKELEQLRARCSMEQQELARLRARCQELEDARMGDAKK